MEKILIVDDSLELRLFYATVLDRCGYRKLETAEDGAEGLLAIERFKPDLVMLNVAMPRLTGWDVLYSLKLKGAGRRPRVVLTTAGRHNTLERAQSAGAIDLFYCPLSLKALLTSLPNLLDPARGEEELRHRAIARHAINALSILWMGGAFAQLRKLPIEKLDPELRKELREALILSAQRLLGQRPESREEAEQRSSRVRDVDRALLALSIAEVLLSEHRPGATLVPVPETL